MSAQQVSNSYYSEMTESDLPTLIFWFTVYYFIERGLRFILNVYRPLVYGKLRASRKDLVFLGIWMGLLITTISTPFCIYGARDALMSRKHSPLEDTGRWSLDPYSKVCVTSRAILWVSELNRLDMYGLYVVHHAGSIVSLLSFLYFQWPLAIFLTLYSTLVSEIPGDLVWLLSTYLDTAEETPQILMRLKSYLVRFNVIQYTLIRGAGVVSVLWMVLINSPGVQDRSILEQAYAYTLLGLYILFCASYVLRQHYNIKTDAVSSLISLNENGTNDFQASSRPSQTPSELKTKSCWYFQLRFGTHEPILLVPYGVFMGLGFAALAVVSLAFGAPSNRGRERLSSALNFTLISAIVGARLLSVVMEDGISRLLARPLHTLLRPGFWLHGGLFGAAVGGLVSYRFGYVEDFSMFAGSLAVGLPLYETFSRIGCHSYGCCYGHIASPLTDATHSDRIIPSQVLWRMFPFSAVRYNHPTHYAVTRINPKLLHVPLVPIQLISATLFLLLFLGLCLPLTYYIRIEIAGSLTLICHVAIRLITETHRADYRGEEHSTLSATGRMALIQAVGALLWLVYTLVIKEKPSPTPKRDWGSLDRWNLVRECIWQSAFPAILGILVYGVHVGEVGSWTGKKVRADASRKGHSSE